MRSTFSQIFNVVEGRCCVDLFSVNLIRKLANLAISVPILIQFFFVSSVLSRGIDFSTNTLDVAKNVYSKIAIKKGKIINFQWQKSIMFLKFP